MATTAKLLGRVIKGTFALKALAIGSAVLLAGPRSLTDDTIETARKGVASFAPTFMPENPSTAGTTKIFKDRLRVVVDRQQVGSAAHKEGDEVKYYFEPYVISTKIDSSGKGHTSPGHASGSLIKEINGEPQIVRHVSFYPGVAGIVNGLTGGVIPVPSLNYAAGRDGGDVTHADRKFRIELTVEQFQAGVDKVDEIEEKSVKGSLLYAISGKEYRATTFLTGVLGSYFNSDLSIANYVKKYGFHPHEDPAGIVLTRESPAQPIEIEAANCTSAVQAVTEAVLGYPLTERCVIPSTLSDVLGRTPGFETVTESLISAADAASYELDSLNEENDAPEP